uniref:3-beta hydroxysteroid dehydrogenase/isomerase domain-containing protein n=1 Tax=Oryza brachyantha TaxID=4533 RepID=J3LPL8_ORYBR
MGTPAENGGSGGARWCAVTGGRGFMARHLVAALLRSGEWRVRVTALAPAVAMDAAEEDGILGAALRDGRAVYAAADVCDIGQLTQGYLRCSLIGPYQTANTRLKTDFDRARRIAVVR